MYAVIETGGETVTFDKVLVIGGETVNVGTPYIDGASVTATVAKNGKSKKIIVYKYKPKKHYHKKQGHRQPYTKVEIKAINA